MSFIDEARAVVVLANKLRKVKPFLHRTSKSPPLRILPSAPISTTPVPSKGKRRVAASTTGGSSGPKPKQTSRAQQPLAMQPSVAEETRLATPVVPLIALQSSVNAGNVGPSRIPVAPARAPAAPPTSEPSGAVEITTATETPYQSNIFSNTIQLGCQAISTFWFTVALGLALGCLFIPPTTPDGKCTFSLANTQRNSISVADLSHFLKWTQDSSKDALGLLNSLTIEVLNEKRAPGHSITFHLIKHSYNITSKELYEAAVAAVLKKPEPYTFDWDRWASHCMQNFAQLESLVNAGPPTLIVPIDTKPILLTGIVGLRILESLVDAGPPVHLSHAFAPCSRQLLEDFPRRNGVAVGRNQRNLMSLKDLLVYTENISAQLVNLQQEADGLLMDVRDLRTGVLCAIARGEENGSSLNDTSAELEAQANALSNEARNNVSDAEDDDHSRDGEDGEDGE
ncbi:hypothetical protein BDR26DRAFT_902715 [Obelidium mucronatum]|nr:hypothetical protein BDR26DRAFT_902715 [Obelidium mucronatum]